MKYLLLITCLVTISIKANAQTKEDEARVLYQKAEDAYEQAHASHGSAEDNKNYGIAQDYLNKIINSIGSNPKVLYLKAKNIYEGIGAGYFSNTEGNYNAVMILLTELFSKINKSTYPPEKYNDIISIKMDVQEKLNKFDAVKIAKSNHQLDMQRRETTFLRDTFDVYMAKFVAAFNDDRKKTIDAKESRKRIDGDFKAERSGFVGHLDYDAVKKILYAHEYGKAYWKDDKNKPYSGDNGFFTHPINIYGPIKIYGGSGNYPQYIDSLVFYRKPDEKAEPAFTKINFRESHTNYKGDDIGGYITTCPQAMFDLIKIMKETGYDEYFKAKNAAVMKNPDTKQTVIQEIEAAIISGKLDGVAEKIQTAIINSPNNKLLYYYLGLTYSNTADVIKIDIAKTNDAATLTALQQKKADNYTKAATSFKKALEIDPNYFEANFYMGYVMLNPATDIYNEANKLPVSKQKEYTDAIAKSDILFDKAKPYVLKAVELNPKAVNALTNLKTYYLGKKDMVNANKVSKQIGDLSGGK